MQVETGGDIPVAGRLLVGHVLERRDPALVEQVLGWARTWDARSVILAVTESNTGGAAFYEHLGFVDTGEREPLREGSELRVRILRREL